MAYSEGLIVIPARYNSHRLPGKALKDIAGKTMIRRTYERAVLSEMDAMVVTDDKRIVNECLSHDIPVDIITAPCFTGTDRVARFAQKVDKKWFINLQGDEPMINPEDIINLNKIREREVDGKNAETFEFLEEKKYHLITSRGAALPTSLFALSSVDEEGASSVVLAPAAPRAPCAAHEDLAYGGKEYDPEDNAGETDIDPHVPVQDVAELMGHHSLELVSG